MSAIPATMVVVGAGVIGCEYSTIFAALGVAVTLIDGRDRLLSVPRRRDRRSSAGADGGGGGAGEAAGQRQGHRSDPGRPQRDAAERRDARGGRRPLRGGTGGEHAGPRAPGIGVAVGERGLIAVNERYQTAVPHIYAAGDVIGFPALASTSMEQARVAMVHAFDLKYKTRMAPLLPLAVYTIPEVAMVGETEEACLAKGVDYAVGRAWYRQNARAQIMGDLAGEVKLVFPARGQAIARRPHRGRVRLRARPPGTHGAPGGGHHRHLHRDGLQLSDARRSVQVCGV